MGTWEYEGVEAILADWEPLRQDIPRNTEIVKRGDVQLHQGDQVVYVPTHCQYQATGEVAQRGRFCADLGEPGIEFGFVTSVSPDGVHAWCRFWRPGLPVGELRTKANSERCEVMDLVSYVSVADWIVQEAILRWCK